LCLGRAANDLTTFSKKRMGGLDGAHPATRFHPGRRPHSLRLYSIRTRRSTSERATSQAVLLLQRAVPVSLQCKSWRLQAVCLQSTLSIIRSFIRATNRRYCRADGKSRPVAGSSGSGRGSSNVLAHKADYVAATEELKLLERAARAKHCSLPENWSSSLRDSPTRLRQAAVRQCVRESG
jgi:hypothetical protein